MTLAPYFALTEHRPEWIVIVDVLGLEMKRGGLGPRVKGTGKKLHMLGKSIAVEVSNSTDVKKEVDKLKKSPCQP